MAYCPIGTKHFGLISPEYLRPRYVPLHLTTSMSPVPLFSVLHTKRAVAWVESVGEFPKFQTGIFVEWKAPNDSVTNKLVKTRLPRSREGKKN